MNPTITLFLAIYQSSVVAIKKSKEKPFQVDLVLAVLFFFATTEKVTHNLMPRFGLLDLILSLISIASLISRIYFENKEMQTEQKYVVLISTALISFEYSRIFTEVAPYQAFLAIAMIYLGIWISNDKSWPNFVKEKLNFSDTICTFLSEEINKDFGLIRILLPGTLLMMCAVGTMYGDLTVPGAQAIGINYLALMLGGGIGSIYQKLNE